MKASPELVGIADGFMEITVSDRGAASILRSSGPPPKAGFA
jgi:hypothetical protein